MNKFYRITIILLALIIVTGFSYITSAGSITHTVQSGDTLWLLAQEYGTTVDAIKATSNHWSNTIIVGQQLRIPTSSSTNTYTVVRGDTLWKIANSYGVTVNQLKAENNLHSDYIDVGLVLTIPSSTPSQPGGSTYTVQPGDSLWRISRQHNTTVDTLKSLNNLYSDYIEVGWTLIVPGGSGSSPDPSRDFTVQELDKIARIVQAESGGEPYEGQVAVAAVILNRLDDPGFPNTISGVIYQPRAFEVVSNDWWLNPAQETAIRAKSDAISGWDPSEGALYFYNPDYIESTWILSRPVIKRIGDHVFAR